MIPHLDKWYLAIISCAIFVIGYMIFMKRKAVKQSNSKNK